MSRTKQLLFTSGQNSPLPRFPNSHWNANGPSTVSSIREETDTDYVWIPVRCRPTLYALQTPISRGLIAAVRTLCVQRVAGQRAAEPRPAPPFITPWELFPIVVHGMEPRPGPCSIWFTGQCDGAGGREAACGERQSAPLIEHDVFCPTPKLNGDGELYQLLISIPCNWGHRRPNLYLRANSK